MNYLHKAVHAPKLTFGVIMFGNGKLCVQHATTRLQMSDAFHSPDAFTANLACCVSDQVAHIPAP